MYTFPIYHSSASNTCRGHNKMSQFQIFIAQTALVNHLLSEIHISYLYTWYVVTSLTCDFYTDILNLAIILFVSNKHNCYQNVMFLCHIQLNILASSFRQRKLFCPGKCPFPSSANSPRCGHVIYSAISIRFNICGSKTN